MDRPLKNLLDRESQDIHVIAEADRRLIRGHGFDALKQNINEIYPERFNLRVLDISNPYGDELHIDLEKIISKDGKPTYPLTLSTLNDMKSDLNAILTERGMSGRVKEVQINLGYHDNRETFMDKIRRRYY